MHLARQPDLQRLIALKELRALRGEDPAYAQRSVTEMYRTTPLRGLWNPPQLRGPYFHDGSAATLEAVVEHYNTVRTLGLTAQQKSDLVHYLKSL